MALLARRLRRVSCCCYLSTSTSPQQDPGAVMSAWQIHRYGGPEELILSHAVKVPRLLSPEDMLIKVHAASVNPIDVRMRGGYGRVMFQLMRQGLSSLPSLQPDTPSEFPLTLGRDFSGVVTATGKSVRRFKPGDEVWGAFRPNRRGSHAQFTVASEKEVSLKPGNLTHVEAGSMPYVSMTAWVALCTIGEITVSNALGQRVLILAGSGGVGNFAIQLMKAWRAEVTTTCSTDAVAQCQSLGADHVIDYRTTDVSDELAKISGFDFILDPIGSKGPAVSFDLLKSFRNSKYVTIVPPLMKNADDSGLVKGTAKSLGSLGCNLIEGFRGGRSYRWALFQPSGRALGTVADLVEKGKIIPVVEKVFPFSEVREAFDKVEGPSARGKTVIDVQKMDTD